MMSKSKNQSFLTSANVVIQKIESTLPVAATSGSATTNTIFFNPVADKYTPSSALRHLTSPSTSCTLEDTTLISFSGPEKKRVTHE